MPNSIFFFEKKLFFALDNTLVFFHNRADTKKGNTMKNSAVFISLMLGVCLNSAESMQQQEKAQFVQEPRSISKELTEH